MPQLAFTMHRSPSIEGPSEVDLDSSEQPQYSTQNPTPSQLLSSIYPYSSYCENSPPPLDMDYAYPAPAPTPLSVHEPRAGTTSTPRLRTSIACRYCLKRKIRCSGRGSAPGGKCSHCSKMNKECIFSHITPAPPFIPAAAALGVVPLRESVYSPFRQPFAPETPQNGDISSPGYGAHPSLVPDHRGAYYNDCRPSYKHKDYVSDSREACLPPGKLQDLQISSKSKGDDCDLSKTSMNEGLQVSNRLIPPAIGKRLSTPQSHERQVRLLSILDLPLPGSFGRQALAKPSAILQHPDQQLSSLIDESGHDFQVKLRKQSKVSSGSSQLPDPILSRTKSRNPSSSSTVPSDIDVVSISGDSEEANRPNRSSQGLRCLTVLSQDELTLRGQSGGNSSKGKEVAKGAYTSSSGTRNGTRSTRGWKNRQQDDDGENEGKDKRNKSFPESSKISQFPCEGRSQFLACPYWKQDPGKYWDCFLKKHDTISHLKQHLKRRHTPKYYCQICYETFNEFEHFDSHALERSCTRDPSAKLEGISQQQKDQLSLRSRGSVEQQWYTIYLILFPDIEPPATVYIDSTQSEDLCRVQEFAQQEGVTIMLDELNSSGLIVRTDTSSKLLRSTVQRAMVSIFRSYSMKREPSSDEAEEPSVNECLEPDHGASLQQQLTTESQVGQGNPTSNDVNRARGDGMDDSMMERLNRSSRSIWSQLPTTASWLPTGGVQDHTEDEPWGSAFLDEPVFGESSSGNDLPFSLESSDMLDLDALLRDVISTEA